MKVETGQGKVVLNVKHDKGGDKERGATVVTRVRVSVGDGEAVTGNAYCHEADNFVRHKGTQLAVKRALSQTTLSKESRTVIWKRLWRGKYED